MPELLQSLLPLAVDTRLNVEWRVMLGPPELHRVAAALADGLQGAETEIGDVIAPGIDPLSPRNLDLAPRLAGRVVRQLGLDTARPLVCQAMRFDRWQDPHLAIEAFALAKGERPELQMVLAGALDSGDGDGWRAVKEITDYAAGEADLHVLTSYSGLGDLELGALQQVARVALRLSLREGFGPAASEAMWKGTPVVGGGGGVPLQVRDGVDGHLTSTAEDTAGRLVELLADPGLAIEMGAAARERVRERFLVTRAPADELALLAAVGAGSGDTLESR